MNFPCLQRNKFDWFAHPYDGDVNVSGQWRRGVSIRSEDVRARRLEDVFRIVTLETLVPEWQHKKSIFTNRVCSTTGRLCFDTCLSICLSTPGGGGYPGRGGVLQPGPAGGGVPHLRYPPSDLAGGYPCWEVPHLGYPPPSDLAGGGTPAGGGGTPPQVIDGVLDTPRSVCLLCSRRRNFLVIQLNIPFYDKRIDFKSQFSYFCQ